MTRRKANPKRLRSEAGHTRRTSEQPCQLMCSSGLPATRCIGGVLICESCFTRAQDIARHPDRYPGRPQAEGAA